MPDRDKVIRGLEDTYQQYSVVKGQGILIDKRNGDEYAWIDPELITDATALLKAQEPRVMKLEELEALPDGDDDNVPVCVEQRYPLDRWDGGAHAKWVGARFVHEEYLSDNRYYNRETYGTTWRCWTGWPILAQREGTPWMT